MPANVRDTGKNIEYKILKEGIHAAVCDSVVMLGLQQDNFGVKEKVYLHFQVPKERVEYEKDGALVNKPMGIMLILTASLSTKATLYHYLTSWRGRAFTKEELAGFDLFNVLGKPCMLTVSHNKTADKTYANIDQITRFQKTMEIAGQVITLEEPQVEGKLLKYSADEPSMLNELPKWLQEKIAHQVKPEDAAEPVAAGPANNGGSGDFQDDDIPF